MIDTDLNNDRLRLESLMQVIQLLMEADHPDEVIGVILESVLRLISA